MQVTVRTFTLLVAALLFQTPAKVDAPRQLWQVDLKEDILTVSLAREAACELVVTNSRAIILNAQDKQDWSVPLAADPNLVAIGTAAISPKCDWFAISTSSVGQAAAASYQLRIIQKDGFRTTIPISEVGSNPYVRQMDISPNGELLAIGFANSALWLATPTGNVRWRLHTDGVEVEPQFSPDGQRLLLKGFFGTGLMNLSGEWIWKTNLRNLAANRDFSLFVGLEAAMHGPQGGDIAILDAKGKSLWRLMAWEATMGIAPNGSFVAFGGNTVKKVQPTVPPFPIVPELNDDYEIWLRDRTGKVLAHRQFEGHVFGVSADSTCTLVTEFWRQGNENLLSVAGLNRKLALSWRLSSSTYRPIQTASDVLIEVNGSTIQAYRIPACK